MAATPNTPKNEEPVARLSIEVRHLETLMNGQKLAPEVHKKYARAAALAKVRAEYDAANG